MALRDQEYRPRHYAENPRRGRTSAHRSRLLLGALLVLLIVNLLAILTLLRSADAQRADAPRAPGAPGQGGLAAPPAAERALGDAFLTPPVPFARVDDTTAQTGALDLDDAVRSQGSDPAAAERRFTGGRSRG